ncbi:MAG: DUF1461 domain-containing protein [Coriobacteriia bacterium]|nr:DUF1461 domain-containing protein [Coriobacteriia bacterium]
MPDALRVFGKATGSLLIGMLLFVFAVGVALLPLELPVATGLLSSRYSRLPKEVARPFAEAARDYVVTGDPEARAILSGSITLDELAHMDDVERVLFAANRITFVLGAVLALWAAAAWRDPQQAARILRCAAAALGLVLIAVVIIGAISFETVFSAFHEMFFAPGTWMFPYDSMLIMVLPKPFWSMAALGWGLFVALVGIGYAGAAWALKLFAGRQDRAAEWAYGRVAQKAT